MWKEIQDSISCNDACKKFMKILKNLHNNIFKLKQGSGKRSTDKIWVIPGIQESSVKKMSCTTNM